MPYLPPPYDECAPKKALTHALPHSTFDITIHLCDRYGDTEFCQKSSQKGFDTALRMLSLASLRDQARRSAHISHHRTNAAERGHHPEVMPALGEAPLWPLSGGTAGRPCPPIRAVGVSPPAFVTDPAQFKHRFPPRRARARLPVVPATVLIVYSLTCFCQALLSTFFLLAS